MRLVNDDGEASRADILRWVIGALASAVVLILGLIAAVLAVRWLMH